MMSSFENSTYCFYFQANYFGFFFVVIRSFIDSGEWRCNNRIFISIQFEHCHTKFCRSIDGINQNFMKQLYSYIPMNEPKSGSLTNRFSFSFFCPCDCIFHPFVGLDTLKLNKTHNKSWSEGKNESCELCFVTGSNENQWPTVECAVCIARSLISNLIFRTTSFDQFRFYCPFVLCSFQREDVDHCFPESMKKKHMVDSYAILLAFDFEFQWNGWQQFAEFDCSYAKWANSGSAIGLEFKKRWLFSWHCTL